MTWSNQPSVASAGSVDYGVAKGADGCPAGDATWNITNIVAGWASGAFPNHGIRLAAGNESSNNSWRRYRSVNYTNYPNNRPHIDVTYNSYPGVPSSLSISESNKIGTVTRTRSVTPVFTTKVSDADPGTSSAQYEVTQAGTVLIPFTRGVGTNAADGSISSFKVPEGILTEGDTYQVRARGTDGSVYSGAGWALTFTVDSTAPEPVTITSSVYPADNTWNGAANEQGTFEVTPSGTGTKVRAWLDEQAPQEQATTGAPVNFMVTPSSTGRHVFKAQAIDAAGNASETIEHSFLVGDLDAQSTSELVNQVVQEHFGDLVTIYDPTDPGDEAIDAEKAAGTFPALDPTTDGLTNTETPPPGFVDVDEPEVLEVDPEADFPTDTLVLPEDSAGLIGQIDSGGVPVTSWDLPQGASSSEAELTPGDVIVYPNSDPGIDTIAVRESENSVETFHLVRSANSASSFTYDPTLLSGQEIIISTDDNIATIVDESGDYVLSVEAPTARDAAGEQIPVSLTNQNGNLVVALAPTSESTVTYPVLVDPTFLARDSSYAKTGAERDFCILPWHLKDCQTARKDAAKARDSANYRFRDYRGSLYQGAGDAYRHCYWSARLRQHIGYDDSYAILTLHESTSKYNDRAMDLNNNMWGRKVGLVYKESAHPIMNSVAWCEGYAHLSATHPDWHRLYMLGPWNCSSPRPPGSKAPLYWSETPDGPC